MTDPQQEETSQRFCVIAVEQGLLTQSRAAKLLDRQAQYAEQGIPMGIGEVAVELGVLTPAQCNSIRKTLREDKRKKKAEAPANEEPEVEHDLQLPCRLGKFEVVAFLGGNMGAVFKAKDTEKSCWVALKVLPADLQMDAECSGRFQRETQAASRLSHPNLIKFYETGQISGRHFISMEFINGASLEAYLGKVKRLPEKKALKVARGIGCGLHHLHTKGIIHRDLKPAKIMVDARGMIRVGGLGLSKPVSEQDGVTGVGWVVGTPTYMAPEIAMAMSGFDHRVDIYGLGMCLFETLCGHPPFEGTIEEVLTSQLESDVPDPKTIVEGVSGATCDLIQHMTQKDPDSRPPHAAVVVSEIDRILQEYHSATEAEQS